MDKNLLIEVESHAADLMLFDDNFKINFKEYSEQLLSTLSEINLYLVDDNYYENETNDEEHKELVATIYGRYFDVVYAINHGINLRDMLDEVDGDTSSLIPYLLDDSGDIKDEYFTLNHNIYYLDRLEVEEKYRGKGYAKFLLKNLPEILMYVVKINAGIIIVQAQPYDKIDGQPVMDYEDNKRKERLIKLYENSGFSRIDNSNYLVLINE